jgi:hypothetical protein
LGAEAVAFADSKRLACVDAGFGFEGGLGAVERLDRPHPRPTDAEDFGDLACGPSIVREGDHPVTELNGERFQSRYLQWSPMRLTDLDDQRKNEIENALAIGPTLQRPNPCC